MKIATWNRLARLLAVVAGSAVLLTTGVGTAHAARKLLRGQRISQSAVRNLLHAVSGGQRCW